jgi:hypothetical protein
MNDERLLRGVGAGDDIELVEDGVAGGAREDSGVDGMGVLPSLMACSALWIAAARMRSCRSSLMTSSSMLS